jgi:hypothetical protein
MSCIKSILTTVGLFVVRAAIDYLEKQKNKSKP